MGFSKVCKSLSFEIGVDRTVSTHENFDILNENSDVLNTYENCLT